MSLSDQFKKNPIQIVQQIDESVGNQVYKEIKSFYNRYGVKPHLILGYRTYLQLCALETKIEQGSFIQTPQFDIENCTPLLRLGEFQGCSITVDSEQEDRIYANCPANTDPWECAIYAIDRS